jgi:hypothetical protein
MIPPPNRFVLPIGKLLERTAWPRDFFGPPRFFSPAGTGLEAEFDTWLDELFARVYFSDYAAIEGDGDFGFQINLWIRGQLVFSIDSFYGFDFTAGKPADDDWVQIPTTVRLGENFEILFHRVKLGVRLPRDIFQLPVLEADAFAEEPFRVEVPISGRLRVDSSFDLHFEPEAAVSFGPIELLESGFMLTVQNAVVDLSREQKIQAIVDGGLPEDFRGFFAQKVIVEPPAYLDLAPDHAVELGEVPKEIEFFMENIGIGTGGLHGTIGVRQKLAESIPVDERPTVTAVGHTLLIHNAPDVDAPAQGDLSPDEFAYALGRTADDAWFFIDTRFASEGATKIGTGWVEAASVHRAGNFTLLPVLSATNTDPFDSPLTFAFGKVALRFEQFYIRFEDSVPVDVGIRASVRVPLAGSESLLITLSLDSSLAIVARLAESLPPGPEPDTSRFDTFALVPQIIILRVDGIELGASRKDREADWSAHILFDLTIFFRWSFGKQNAEAGELMGASLTGLGYKDGKLAFPESAKLKLSSGASDDDAFKRGLKIGPLAFSVDSLGVGIDSSGASFLAFAGSVAFSEAFKAKGTLGLRFRWRDGEFLGVAFEKARLQLDSTSLEGDILVEFVDEAVPVDDHFEQRQGWRGRGELLMKVPPNIFVNVQAAFGSEPVRHVYLFVEVGSNSQGFTVGPIAFYGISGLFGYNFVPDKRPDELWYEDWFRDKLPRFSAVAVEKWRVEQDAIAFGLGTTIGTSGDKGYAFSGKVIFILSFPGPVFLLAGYGNFLTAIEELQHPERALLALLFVYDGNADTISGDLSLQYQQPRAGTKEAQTYGAGFLLDTYGLLDVFFDLARSSNWHIYLGERPKEKRIRAELVKFLRVDLYLMIDPSMFELGASVGWDWRKKWGPLRVELAAWIEGVLGVVYEPTQAFGALRVGGHARLSAFGIGAGITLGADLSGGGPHPWFYHVELVFRLETPWFLPDIKVRAEFGERNDAVPPVPLALRSMALTHDLPIADAPAALFPNLDPDGDRLFIDPVDTSFDEGAAVAQAPLVPLDGKPAIGFGHPFNDRTGLVDNPPGELYTEAYGEEGFFRYDLTQIQLWKRPRRSGAAWTLVDERLPGVTQDPIDWSDYQGDLHIFGHTRLYGKLLFDDSRGERQPVGLRLWARTPFNIHMAGDDEAEETAGENPNYPCPPSPDKPSQECADYSGFSPGQPLAETHRLGRVTLHSPHGGRVLASADLRIGVYPLVAPVERLRIDLPERALSVIVRLDAKTPLTWLAGREGAVIFQKEGDFTDIVQYSDEKGIDWLELFVPKSADLSISIVLPTQVRSLRLRQVCFLSLAEWQDLLVALEAADQLQSAYPPGFDVQAETLLEPDQEYRLTLQTEVLYSEDGLDFQSRQTFVQHAYFKTAGPPGLFPTSSALKDLLPYVDHNVPFDGTQPVYRSYDIRVGFRDDAAVRGMYARSLETLRLFISDGTEGLAQSLDGRPELIEEDWLRDNRIRSNYQLLLWHKMLRDSSCIEPGEYSGGDVLTATPVELLQPDRRYQASLVLGSSPFLRRSRFEIGDLAAMTQVDSGTLEQPGRWEVVDGILIQRSEINSPPDAGLITGRGSALVFGDANWRNYQVSATLASEDGRLGLLAGYQDANNFYLAAMDAAATEVELIRVLGGVWQSLAVRQPANPTPGPAHSFIFVYTGEWLQVILDEEALEPVFESIFPRGRAGVFTSGAAGASFVELLVSGVPLHGFAFTTSRYANFQAQIASFPGAAAHLQVAGSLADIAAELVLAWASFPANADDSAAADQARNAAFATALEILGLPAGEPPDHLDVTQLENTDGLIAWLIESPEPLRWRERTSLSIARQEQVAGDGQLDPGTLHQHRDSLRLIDVPFVASPLLPGLSLQTMPVALPEVAGGVQRVTRRNPLDKLVSRNRGGLKLLGLAHDPDGRAYLEFMAGETTDLGGLRLQFRSSPPGAAPDYQDFFTFPPDTHLKEGQRLRIYAGGSPDPGGEGKELTKAEGLSFASKAGLPEALAEQGTLLRLVDWHGFVVAIFPFPPFLHWVTLDPAHLRMLFTADTRKVLVFFSGDTGLPQVWYGGQYRFTFSFLRDLGDPASTWSDHGSTTPETAAIYLTAPGEPPPPPPTPPRHRLRLLLDEIAVLHDLDPWWKGAGELTLRVTLTPEEGLGEPIVVDLPPGGGSYRVRAGTRLDLRTELVDEMVGAAGLSVQIEGRELDLPDGDDILPPIIFHNVGARRRPKGGPILHPQLAEPGLLETTQTLEQGNPTWSAKLRAITSPSRKVPLFSDIIAR